MKIKIIMAIILLALVAIACTGSKKAVTESKAGEQVLQQAADNETIPPGTVIKQTTGQIKFKVVPPDDGSGVSV